MTPLENELILKLTNKWVNEQKTKSGNKNIVAFTELEKYKYRYMMEGEDAKYASSDMRGNKKELYKAH